MFPAVGKQWVSGWREKNQHTKKVAMKDLRIGSLGPFSGSGPSLRPSFTHDFPEVLLEKLPLSIYTYIWYLFLPIKSADPLASSDKKKSI